MPLLIQGYGARVIVDGPAPADLAPALADLLPPQLRLDAGEAGAEADAFFTVRCIDEDAFELLRDGAVLARAQSGEALLQTLCSQIELAIAVAARAGTFVHAGVVGWRGVAILVPGSSHTGKTNLVASLVHCGATYYSDEYAVVDADGLVHPYARPLVLRQSGQRLRLPPGSTPLPPALIVATTFRPGAVWAPLVLEGARAVLPILDNIVVMKPKPALGLRLAARLGAHVVTLQGQRPEAAEIAPSILDFVDRLLDDEGARPSSIRRATGSRLAPPGGSSKRDGEAALPRSLKAPRLRPARHLRVDNLLAPEEHRRLLEFAQAREAELAASLLGVGEAPGFDPSFRLSRARVDLDEVWDLFERRLRVLLPYVRRELAIPWFCLGAIERQLHAQRDGDLFGIHADNGQGRTMQRRISAVYSFFETPRRFQGGELHLHDTVERAGRIEAAPSLTVLEPVDNSLLFLPSDAVHEVQPLHSAAGDFRGSRFSVTFCFHATDHQLGSRPAAAREAVTAKLESPTSRGRPA